MNIVLIGMRGAGKSSIARWLQVITKRPVLSTDLLISYEAGGQSIPALVAAAGGDWRPFRELEYQVVEKVAALDGLIVDGGGGVIVDLDEQGGEIFSARKVQALKRHGVVVWIREEIQRLVNKVANDPTRPNLSEVHSAEELMRRRLPFYEQAADIVVDRARRRKAPVVEEVLTRLQELPGFTDSLDWNPCPICDQTWSRGSVTSP